MINLVNNFINKEEQSTIIEFVNNLQIKQNFNNKHISNVANYLNGSSSTYDITKTDISNYLSKFQSDDNIYEDNLPIIFLNILNRISKKISINNENVFLQIIDMNKGGKIIPHYDTSIEGYINFKCNICILSDDYSIFIDKTSLHINELDLYTFEASLYKHWTNEFNNRRIILSYGFALKYEDLNRSELDPRVRLSQRIQKYFQN